MEGIVKEKKVWTDMNRARQEDRDEKDRKGGWYAWRPYPHRAQMVQLEFFELILLSKLDKQFPVEQFEATISQSSVPSLPS